MATKRNPKQEAKAAAEKALAAAAKKQAAEDAKAAAMEKKAAAAKRKTAAAKEKAVSKAKAAAVAAPPSTQEPASEDKDPRLAKRRRWPLWAAAVIVAVLLLAVAGFSWDRWLRYDDAADFQGEWYLADSAKTVVIDGSVINLTDEVAFSYQIDPFAKTISFSFGDKANTGRYRFSADRKQLIVVEGSSFTTLSTLFEDLAWTWDNLVRGVQGEQPVLPEAGNGTTVFQRERAATPVPAVIEEPAVQAPPSEAPATSEPPAPSADAGNDADAPAGTSPDEQSGTAEPEPPADQNSASPSLPGTMFDDVADQ